MDPAATQAVTDGSWSQAPAANGTMPASPIPELVFEAEIGRGGMGVVYRGRQTYLDRQVAVKLLLVQGPDAKDFTARFQREAKILASLSHPHIVACLQAGLTAASHPYLVMEFIDGPNLAKHIDNGSRLDVHCALRLTKELATALAHAHEHGIIHRDVKPENVLLAPAANTVDGMPFCAKLVDLGLARPGGAGSDLNLTRPGAIMGTPTTMAPEQFDDPDGVDYRADIYGLGCVLYHALVGKPAFESKTIAQLVTQKVNGDAPRPTRAKADVPEAVSDFVATLLDADRNRRPQSYDEIIAACDTLLGNSTQRIGKHGGRSAWIGLACAIVILGGAVAAWWLNQPHATAEMPAPAPTVAASPIPPAPTLPTAIAASAASPVNDRPRIDLTTLSDTDWGAPKPLWAFDQSQRLSAWKLEPEAQWSSADDVDDAVAGIVGRISRPIPTLPCRLTGTILHTHGSGEQSDVARVGFLLQDGSRVDLTVLNLGEITHTQVNAYRADSETPVSTRGPVTLPATRPVVVNVAASATELLAWVDGTPFSTMPLSSPPVRIYLAAEGKAPVIVEGLAARSLVPR